MRNRLVIVISRWFNIIVCRGIEMAALFAEAPFDTNNPSDFDRKVINFAGRDGPRGEWVNADNRDRVIQRLRMMRALPEFRARVDSFDSALVSLGDEEATARVVEAKLAGHGGLAAGHLTEVALPYMVNAFYTADPKGMVPRTSGDVWAPSMKENIMSHFFGIVQASRLFTDETRQWASESFRFGSGLPEKEVEEKARLAQQWWEHNGKAVLEKRYREATWLPTKAEDGKQASMPNPEDAKRVWPPGSKQSNSASVQDPPGDSSSPSVATAPEGSRHAGRFFLWFGIAFAILCSGWLFRRARKRRNGH